MDEQNQTQAAAKTPMQLALELLSTFGVVGVVLRGSLDVVRLDQGKNELRCELGVGKTTVQFKADRQHEDELKLHYKCVVDVTCSGDVVAEAVHIGAREKDGKQKDAMNFIASTIRVTEFQSIKESVF